MTHQVLVYPDRQALVEAALTLVLARIHLAIDQRGSCSIALSGGSTPQPLYAALAHADLPWQQIQIYWGDERYVPATDQDSNYGMTKRAWLDLVPIPAENVHPMPTNFADPGLAAAEYDRQLHQNFGTVVGQIPTFDLVLLGMGDDGHTASLFPHTAALSVRDRLVTVGEKDGEPRLTFTFSLLNQSRCVMFLISGTSKQTALTAVFAPNSDLNHYPSWGIKPQGELLWLLDAAANPGLELLT
jgi:6-phosphogluconolactonase